MLQCDRASEIDYFTTSNEVQTARHRARKVVDVLQPSKVHESLANPKRKSISNRDIDQTQDVVLEPKASHDEGKCNLILTATAAPFSARLEDAELSKTAQQEERERQCEPHRELGAVKEKGTQTSVQHAPPSCSQCHASIDTKQATNELQLAKTASTADVSRHDSQFANILSAAKFTESLSVSAWIPSDTPGAGGTQLSNVTFRGCKGSGLKVMPECKVVNVKFIDCKFKSTTFLDVTLENVTFSHVDFTDATFYYLVLRNVTLSKVCFNNDVWRNLSLENALIGKHSFMLQPSTIRDYGLQPSAASSRTKQDAFIGGSSLEDLKREVGHDEDWDRDIHIRFGSDSEGILTRLAIYRDIVDRVMRLCFPGSSLYIYEYPHRSNIPDESKMSQKLFCRRIGNTLTTYFGSLQYGLSVGSKTIPRRGVGNCVSLLSVNKKFSELASEHLYGRSLHLQCSADGAIAFLLTHEEPMKLVKQLVLHYHWSDDQLGLVTDKSGWRYLLGKVRHRFSFIANIRLHIGQSFWKHNDIDRGLGYVLGTYASLDRPLFDAHKFAAPDDRWETEDDESTHRTDGMILEVYIEDSSSQVRTEFVKKMLVEIEKQRVGRPLFVQSDEGKEITYKCAKKADDEALDPNDCAMT